MDHLIENNETELSKLLSDTCVLEAKIDNQWKTVITHHCQTKDVESAIEYLQLIGDKQFSRYEKRRARHV